jgi:hypothetical protein
LNKLKRLIERGYFPSQLPPPLITAGLAARRGQLTATWPQVLNRIPSTRGEHFSVARAGHSRRPITIPNPVNQFYLSQAIATYWNDLQRHFKRSRLSLSRPILKGTIGRATEVVPLSDLAERRLILSSSFRYVLKTDISRFFPTLYTHSVPWALHGKAQAKANQRNRTATFFGNIIDYLMQGSQERQTIGIPIGPDTSHIVSDIIATSVDLQVRAQLGRWPVGYRHVDDFFLCFNTREEAEAALTTIVKALREFELDINPAKTFITEADDLREDDWVDHIKTLHISDEGRTQRQDLHRFFARALDLAREDENALKYALKKSIATPISLDNWEVYEAYLLRCGMIAPNCMQTIVHLLVTYHLLGYSLDKGRIANFCANVIVLAARGDHHSEIAWALWLARELLIPLRAVATRALSELQSSVCALIALDLRDKGLLRGKLETRQWEQWLQPSGLRGPMWLLAYEASSKQWLRHQVAGFVQKDDFFGAMQQASISFYDDTRRLRPLIWKREFPDFGEDGYEFADETDEYVA